MGKYDEVMKLIEDAIAETDHENYIFRGMSSNKYDKVSSRRYREIDSINNKDNKNKQLERIERKEISHLKNRFYNINVSNIEILSDLQHYDGKTSLIDFSKSLFIALFFSCCDKFADDGEVIFLSKNKLIEIEEINYTLNELGRENSLFLISPVSCNNRVLFQRSVFVYSPKGYIDNTDIDFKLEIPAESKASVLRYLSKYHDINYETIYFDIHGYIKSIQEKREKYYLAISLIKDNPAEATARLNALIDVDPLNDRGYYFRAICYSKMRNFEQSLIDLESAIEINSDFSYYILRSIVNIHVDKLDFALNDIDHVYRRAAKGKLIETLECIKYKALISYLRGEEKTMNAFLEKACWFIEEGRRQAVSFLMFFPSEKIPSDLEYFTVNPTEKFIKRMKIEDLFFLATLEEKRKKYNELVTSFFQVKDFFKIIEEIEQDKELLNVP